MTCDWCVVVFFKQKTAYEIGTGDWSSDVCSSDLKNLIMVFSATDNLRNLKLHHIDYGPNMTLCNDLDRKSVV